MGKHKEKSKKHKKQKRQRKHSTSSNSSDEWVEKKIPTSSDDNFGREKWMSLPTNFASSSNVDKKLNREISKRLERESEKYDPARCSRELNPYWKDGGDGLPKFLKPSDYDDSDKRLKLESGTSTANWRKSLPIDKPKQEAPPPASFKNTVTNGELNVLAAKLVKAEIMGDVDLINELKEKLVEAKRLKITDETKEEAHILTQTNSRGVSRPLLLESQYGESTSQGKNKKRKLETHMEGERVRYFPDDNKRSLQQMFENEKYDSVDDSNRQFLKMVGKVGKNDDLDDIFTDNIRKKVSDESVDRNNRNKAIGEHDRISETLDNCTSCLNSEKMLKHLVISTYETIYLSVPSFEPLSENHCIITPIRHVSCSTQLEENEWSELIQFRRALTKMFQVSNREVIFFETAMFLHRHPHMNLHCVPVDKNSGSLAPIYFKKAIEESETEWSSNKKLVSLKGRDVRRAIPKGLPYFSVSFGMEEGFAHVIEDQRLFPINFAQEVIGGILDLHHTKWRKPKVQKYNEQSLRATEFSKYWKTHDFTTTNTK